MSTSTRPLTASAAGPRGRRASGAGDSDGSSTATTIPAGRGGRPQSAGGDVPGPPSVSVFTSTKDKANTSSEELIRDLENKVRRVVDQKRAESDKLRFAVARRREEVEKAKLLLQDLLKDSAALGLHYNFSTPVVAADKTHAGLGTSHAIPPEDDPTRLQPIVSISRRPVYSKHTKISELESRLERRAIETHQVHRRTLVLDHIKKRLLNERMEIAQTTNQLKHRYGELNHETQELQKRDISAAEAVNQVQTRLAQQKVDMATSLRKFKRELALRHKWIREKAKFEKYYNDQLQSVRAKCAVTFVTVACAEDHIVTPGARKAMSPVSILRAHKPSSSLQELPQEGDDEILHKEAFLRIGVDSRVEVIDPEEILRICLAHDELKKELDSKQEETVARIALLRGQIENDRSSAREDVPLSKRGTSQKIETKQLEISVIERQLATVVDQYRFVEQSVRPIKIGLQQILQNVTNATVNFDNIPALEKALIDTCEELMRMLRETSPDNTHDDAIEVITTIHEEGAHGDDVSHPESESLSHITPEKQRQPEPIPHALLNDTRTSSERLPVFTSPYNVRISPKKRERYIAPCLIPEQSRKSNEGEDEEENPFDVMDRAMVKRVSSVVVCTSAGKKGT